MSDVPWGQPPGRLDAAQRIGRLVDKQYNYLFLIAAPMSMAQMYDALLTCVEETKDELKALYVELTGEDKWAGQPGL